MNALSMGTPKKCICDVEDAAAAVRALLLLHAQHCKSNKSICIISRMSSSQALARTVSAFLLQLTTDACMRKTFPFHSGYLVHLKMRPLSHLPILPNEAQVG